MNCEKRKPGCHSKCNHYKFLKILNDKKRRDQKEKSDLFEFILQERGKILKISIDNCKKYH